MDRPFPLRFMLPSPAKQLRIERIHQPDICHWRLWLMTNGDFSLGTFLKLNDDGSIERVTWHENGTETIVEVKP